ncbi:HigA family addiction module antitoxin [Azospirillum halopraeferens]|uniref:HigA family addiction module antitoxin n=1 Tax=Azospirillum halopraeferens TaxID=34010 RepID=UPI000400AD0F|nr:HigA family addiction module antitoxin [Azospirillum halopraeferens]
MPITTHPGEILREEFLEPMGLSVDAPALALRVPVSRMNGIVHERRAVTADTALRLARYFGTTPQFRMNLQTNHDLSMAAHDHGGEIERDIQPREAA